MKFNSKLTVSNTGGNLSTDSGLILVKEFMDSLNFSDLSKQHLEIEDKRLYHTHDNFSLMEQLIYQNIAGYSTDSSANLLKKDPIFKVVLDKSKLASQASLSRFWDSISEENISQLQELNQAMIDKVRLARNTTEMIFDLDSTSDMNTSSPTTQIMSLRKQYFGHTANVAQWKTSLKRRRMASILIRSIALHF